MKIFCCFAELLFAFVKLILVVILSTFSVKHKRKFKLTQICASFCVHRTNSRDCIYDRKKRQRYENFAAIVAVAVKSTAQNARENCISFNCEKGSLASRLVTRKYACHGCSTHGERITHTLSCSFLIDNHFVPQKKRKIIAYRLLAPCFYYSV